MTAPLPETPNSLQSIFEKMLPDFGEELERSALSATFQLACNGFICSEYFSNADEETTTGALLGAIAATAPWCFQALSQEPDLNWIRFAKSGNARNAEPSTGADFALILRVTDKLSRLAIFQAKCADSCGNFSVHQISPERASQEKIPEPQFIRLMDFARDVENAIQVSEESRKLLSWVHYIAYEPDAIIATPLSALRAISEHYDSYRENAESLYKAKLAERYPNTNKRQRTTRRKSKEEPRVIDHTVASSIEKSQVAADIWSDFEPESICSRDNGIQFITLLTIGASPTMHRHPGWLELDSHMKLGRLLTAVKGKIDIYVGRIDDSVNLDLSLKEILDGAREFRVKRREQISAELINTVTSELESLFPNAEPEPDAEPESNATPPTAPRKSRGPRP
ncbi:hypothetical protein [Xanthomonas sp. JAI131]|uniref:hypothetical protein n=1 Tax=unclassified Xanthomonas TaxID=2643310 RepID=UPI0015C91C20|nr:hypothetical protein [Xanthomonas sp. JAI131]